MKYLQLLPYLALAALAGCGEPPAEAVTEPVALVSLERAVTADLPVIVHSYGRIEFEPSGKHILNAEIEARVLALKAVAGDRVEQGQEIVQLVPSSAGETAVSQASRDAAAARAAAARTKRLRADGLAGDADVEAADTAAMDLSELALSLEARAGSILTLRAPVSGIVDGILAAPGDLIAPGTAIVQLASPSALQARLGIEVEDAPRVAVGASVQVRSLDNSASQTDGEIRQVDTRIDPATRMASALVAIPAGRGFLPGEAVQADITVGTHKAAVVVARAAVFNDESGTYVFLAREGTAALQRVETGLTSAGQTEIRKGVTTGDDIIVEGAATLADGMRIRTAPAGAAP